jgi:hypothetical protein
LLLLVFSIKPSSNISATGFALYTHSFFQPRSFALQRKQLNPFTLSKNSIKMRSDLIALTAAVAGCAVAAPAARPQWGSWGQEGGWGNGGSWGTGPDAPPAAGIPAPTAPAPTGTGAPFPTGTGVIPSGTGVLPTGTGAVQPIRAAATGTAPVASASPAASGSSGSSAGQTGESTAADGLNTLFVAKGKEYFGTCADPGTLGSEAADIIKADFGQITPENRYVHPRKWIVDGRVY